MAGEFQKFEDTGMEIKEFDNVDTQNVLVDGQPAHVSSLAKLINYRPDADSIQIPGQRKPGVRPGTTPQAPMQYNPASEVPGLGGNFDPGPLQPPIRRQKAEDSDKNLIKVEDSDVSAYKPSWTLAILEDAYYFSIDLPGLDKSMVKVGINENILSISGEYPNLLESMRQDIREKKGLKPKKDPILESKSVLAKPPKFKYPFKLTKTVDKTGISATMNNGVLRILLPFNQNTEDTEIQVL